MPGDITLAFLTSIDDRVLSAEKDDRRYLVGDVVDAFRSEDVATWSGTEWAINLAKTHPRLAFLHIVAAPDRLYAEPWRLAQGLRVPVPEAPDDGEYEEIRARRFRVVRENMPALRRSEIRDNRETTMAWLAVKSLDVLRRKSAVRGQRRVTDTELTAGNAD